MNRKVTGGLLAAAVVSALAFFAGRVSTGDEWALPLADSVADRPSSAALEVANIAPGQMEFSLAALPAQAVPAAAQPQPLPPLEQPLAESFDALLDRVRRGDARAACRLAVDLARCHQNKQLAEWSSSYEREAARTANDERARRITDQVVMLDSALQRNDVFCANIDAERLQVSFPVQLAAARWNPELRLWLASQPALDPQRFLQDLDAWREYRAVALPWLREAALAGDPTAQVLMARVHGDDRRTGPPIPPFRELDDAAFVTWAQVLNRRNIIYQAVERAAAEAQQRLGPQASAAALAEADRILAASPAEKLDEEAGKAVTRQSFTPAPSAEFCDG